jgi:hypothetical protein
MKTHANFTCVSFLASVSPLIVFVLHTNDTGCSIERPTAYSLSDRLRDFAGKSERISLR